VKVLHVDENDYYGGLDAGLSLGEAEKWIQAKQGTLAGISYLHH
jgi:RAB protein geranylgeranyltransferase component A